MSDEKKDFIREIIAADIASGKHAAPITRFPPEPNGYLHIGHAKAIGVNFGIAKEYAAQGARCHLRFDDTNPLKEDNEYVESIKEDLTWLGYDWGEHLYFASDYFEYFYDCAVALIEKGLAYVDTQSLDEIRAQRGNVTVVGTASPHRSRSVEENLELFKKMRAGGFEEGAAVLRAHIDMESFNMNLRDPVLYRVVHASHHHAGDQWCIYPMYDFAHPLEDAKEHITHSLCSLEFENHRPLYDWKMAVLDPVKVVVTNYPEGESELVSIPNHPQDESRGTRELTFTREFWIEREDFMIEAPKKFFRLKPGGAVRLKGAYIIQHCGHLLDDQGEVSEIHCEFIPDTIGQSPPEGVKCRTAIHWVSCSPGPL